MDLDIPSVSDPAFFMGALARVSSRPWQLVGNILRILAVDLQHITADAGLQLSPKILQGHGWMQDDDRLRRVAEMISMMAIFVAQVDIRNNGFIGKDDYLDGIRAILCIDKDRRRQLDALVPHLRFKAFIIASDQAMVTIVNGNLGKLDIWITILQLIHRPIHDLLSYSSRTNQ